MCILIGQNSRVDQKEINFIAVTFTGTSSPFHDQCILDFFPSYLQNASRGEKSWEVLLGHVISELSKGKIYEEGDAEELTVVLANLMRIFSSMSPFCLLFKFFSLAVIMIFL